MKKLHSRRGFSLVEILTVIAIIGVMSLIGVPAFINYQKALSFKNSMRTFTSDLRGARQRAVAQTSYVKVGNIRNGGTSPETYGEYDISESTDRGATYTPLQTRRLEKRSTFDGTPDDLVFLPNGTVQLPAGTYSRTIRLVSLDTIAKPEYDIEVAVTGKVGAQ